MKEIQITCITYAPKALYQKAKSKNQRALLGYMLTEGYVRDYRYGGAFRLITEVESADGVYHISTVEPPKVTAEIIRIAESAMAGLYDGFTLSEREIRDKLFQLRTFQGKGGK